MTKPCRVDGCDAPGTRKALCNKHYKRFKAHGDPTITIYQCYRTPIEERMAERTERRGDCLIYTWGRSARSGHVMVGFHGKRVGVHRVSWILVNGPIPEGMVVRHKCDVPRCVEPSHLELGSVADNNRDRAKRRRTAVQSGASNSMAKLTDDAVIQIRKKVQSGESQRSIARAFQVSQRTVWNIANGVTYVGVGAA